VRPKCNSSAKTKNASISRISSTISRRQSVLNDQ